MIAVKQVAADNWFIRLLRAIGIHKSDLPMQLRQGPPGYYINHLGQLIPESYVHEYQQQEYYQGTRPFSDGTVTFGAAGSHLKNLFMGE